MSAANYNTNSSKNNKDKPSLIQCDYLVIGAGTSGMSFIDTILTESSIATIVLVDRNSKAGGHWTMAYPHVKLHQGSCNYGVNSMPLGKVLRRNGNELFDMNDRATGQEIVEYYGRVLEKFVESGRVKIYMESEYSTDEQSGNHVISSHSTKYHVKCQKLVRIHSQVIVPSMRKGNMPFPTHPEAPQIISVNQIPDLVQSATASSPSSECASTKKYIVIGAGKTGVDTIEYLLRNGIDQSNITWIISRDVWYLNRDEMDPGTTKCTYWQNAVRAFLQPMLEKSTCKDVILELEKANIMARLDPDGPFPESFKGSMLDTDILNLIRTIQDVVRKGRVRSITEDSIILEQGSLYLSSHKEDTVIVDCMANIEVVGSCYGYNFPSNFTIYEQGQINLGPLFFIFNPSLCAAMTAFLDLHLNDDAVKNDMLYYLRGIKVCDDPTHFISVFYSQMQTIQAIGTYPPAMKFLLTSRTNVDSPLHHKGGILSFLWAAFGPSRMKKKVGELQKKITNGGFSDIGFYGCDRPLPDKKRVKKAIIKKRK